MQIVLRPNITFNKNKDKNLTDSRPLRGESFERKGKGPVKKNFDIPNALDNKLRMNVINGSHHFESNTFRMVLAWKPSAANRMQREIIAC